MKKKEIDLEAIVDNLNRMERSRKEKKAPEKPVEKKPELKEVQKPAEVKKTTKEIADQDWKKVGSMLFSRPVAVDDEPDQRSLPRRLSDESIGKLESGLASSQSAAPKSPSEENQAKYLPANQEDKAQAYLIQGYQPKRYEDQAQQDSSRFRPQQNEQTAMERIEHDALSASTPGSGMRMALEENRTSTQKYKSRQSK